MLKTFANTFKVPELRNRILFTIGLVLLCRLLASIPLPGIDWRALQDAIKVAQDSSGMAGGLLSLMDTFSGGAMGQCAIGFLGIWPYISASIIIQLMTAVIPQLEKLAREGDSGRKKINQYTRYLTIGICMFQGTFLVSALLNPAKLGMSFLEGIRLVLIPGSIFMVMSVMILTTVSLFMMWLGDQITSRGVGNGVSLLIMINIISRLPNAIIEAWTRYFGFGPEVPAVDSPWKLLILLFFGFLVFMGTVALTQGLRKIPIHSTRRIATGGSGYGGGNTFLPLRVNYAGVMPVIFAGPLMQFPGMFLARIDPGETEGFMHSLLSGVKDFGEVLSNSLNVWNIVIFAVLILFFSFFWVASQFNAMSISDNLKQQGSYIPGVRPGRSTAEFLDGTMTRVTFIGAGMLLLIAIIPQILVGQMQVPSEIATFFGGTSLLIVVGVALDTLRQMESHLLMRNYDGFLKHGRLQGRK